MRSMPIRYSSRKPAQKLARQREMQVIQKIGLCICLYDILKASDGLIGHGTGIVHVNGKSMIATKSI